MATVRMSDKLLSEVSRKIYELTNITYPMPDAPDMNKYLGQLISAFQAQPQIKKMYEAWKEAYPEGCDHKNEAGQWFTHTTEVSHINYQGRRFLSYQEHTSSFWVPKHIDGYRGAMININEYDPLCEEIALKVKEYDEAAAEVRIKRQALETSLRDTFRAYNTLNQLLRKHPQMAKLVPQSYIDKVNEKRKVNKPLRPTSEERPAPDLTAVNVALTKAALQGKI